MALKRVEKVLENNGVALDFTELTNQAMTQLGRFMQGDRARKYTKEQIRMFLDNPETSERQLRKLAIYLMGSSSQYMRLIMYKAGMLTLDNIVVPVNMEEKDITNTSFKTGYMKASDLIEKYSIKHEFRKIITIIMNEDVFYGVEVESEDSILIQRLPSDYCRIDGAIDGIFTFKMDMSFFNGKREELLENLPPLFRRLYKSYRETGKQWYSIDPKIGVCFKFREDIPYCLPPFAGTFEEILNLEELKDLAMDKKKVENFKLLFQKIPFKKDPKSEKDFMISLDSVKLFHANIKATLPSQIGLISSPMDITDFSFERNKNTDRNNVLEAQEEIYSGIGVSSGMFNSGAKSSIALNRAIQTDETMMFGLLRQIERFLNVRLANKINGKFKFQVVFPNLSEYNLNDKFEQYLKSAQYGFPKSLVAATLGYSSKQLVNLTHLENGLLNLDSILIPLTSSHTQNNEDGQGTPEKKEQELSDKGLEARDGSSNENRS